MIISSTDHWSIEQFEILSSRSSDLECLCFSNGPYFDCYCTYLDPPQIAWAPGQCMKEKQWKDYWDVELGVSYIPFDKLDPQIDMTVLEDGGMFDEETMPEWMKSMRNPDSSLAQPGLAQQQFMQQQQEMQQLPGPPPGFVRIPEGMSPAMVQQQVEPVHLPVPGAGPPVMSPFGIPPGNFFLMKIIF